MIAAVPDLVNAGDCIPPDPPADGVLDREARLAELLAVHLVPSPQASRDGLKLIALPTPRRADGGGR